MNDRIATSLIGVFLLAGCGDHSIGAQESTAGAGSLIVAPVGDPCEGGPAGCVSVGRVDVDGDHVLDAVGIAAQPDPATITVRVATAHGLRQDLLRLEQLSSYDNPLPAGAFVGAFSISRALGADLVIQTRFGQGNSDEFHVIGWQNGDLVDVPHPPVIDTRADNPAAWTFMGSHGKQVWVTCDGGGAITVNNQSAPTAEGVPIPGGGILEADHWKFENGTWTSEGSENTQAGEIHYDPHGHDDVFRCENQKH